MQASDIKEPVFSHGSLAKPRARSAPALGKTPAKIYTRIETLSLSSFLFCSASISMDKVREERTSRSSDCLPLGVCVCACALVCLCFVCSCVRVCFVCSLCANETLVLISEIGFLWQYLFAN